MLVLKGDRHLKECFASGASVSVRVSAVPCVKVELAVAAEVFAAAVPCRARYADLCYSRSPRPSGCDGRGNESECRTLMQDVRRHPVAGSAGSRQA
jgi:hypothetical protein